MRDYAPKKLQPFSLSAMVLRCLAGALRFWWILAIAAFFYWDMSLALRISYVRVHHGAAVYYRECEYFGTDGWITFHGQGDCPLMLFSRLDSRL